MHVRKFGMEAKTQKSAWTRQAIIDAALDVANQTGLQSITLQAVADRLQLSKSGIFSRVGSKESLQIAVASEYGKQFLAEVFLPSLGAPNGVPRLNALVTAWINRVSNSTAMGQCVFEAAAFTVATDAKDPVRQNLIDAVQSFRQVNRRTVQACIDSGQFKPSLDPDDFLFEMHGIMLIMIYDRHFLSESDTRSRALKAWDALVARHLLKT